MATNRDEDPEGTWKGCSFLCASVKRGLGVMWSPGHTVKFLGSAQQPHFCSLIPPTRRWKLRIPDFHRGTEVRRENTVSRVCVLQSQSQTQP